MKIIYLGMVAKQIMEIKVANLVIKNKKTIVKTKHNFY